MKLLLELERTERGGGVTLKPGQRVVDLEQHAAQMRQIEQMRQEVAARRRELATAERTMVRRWAAPHAAMAVAALVLIVAASLAGGWVAAGMLAPPVRTASVTLRATSELPRQRTPEALEQWTQWHRARLGDQSFIADVAGRMAAVRIDRWSDPAALATRLDRDLTVRDGTEGALTLTLMGEDAGEIQSMLDVLAVALATDSIRTFRGRTEQPWAQVAGERTDGGAIRHAALDGVLVSDRRLQVAGPIAGGLLVVLLGFSGGSFMLLQRARREIDEDGTLFTDSNDLGMIETLRSID